MASPVITVADVKETLEIIASASPDRIDTTAVAGGIPRYVTKGKPNCLVARVLAELGISTRTLSQLDYEVPVGGIVDAGVKIAESRNPELRRLVPAARALLQFVQDKQDRGARWGRAARAALRRNPLIPARIERVRKPWLFV